MRGGRLHEARVGRPDEMPDETPDETKDDAVSC